MISPQCFTTKWIDHLREKHRRTDPGLLEKTIYAFELLGLLARTDQPFIFKGGTALLLHLNDLNRLSIDIDIVGSFDQVDLEEAIKGSVFTDIREDIRADGQIPKKHYLFRYHSQFPQRNPYVLLDILEVKNPYSKIIKKKIQSDLFLVDEELTVSIPSIDSLLGDKLTAFAPETIGVLYHTDKSMEIIKQLYDVGKLIDHAQDVRVIDSSYKNLCKLEGGFHQKKCTYKDVLEDTIQASYLLCQIDLRGYEENDRTRELRQGVRQIQSHLLNMQFSLQDAKVAASKAAFLAYALKSNFKLEPFQYRYNTDKIMELRDTEIKGRFSILNRIKSSLPEAFYYWYLISQWENA
jgi:predicted nucleotidyltransferase component of viral defense system